MAGRLPLVGARALITGGGSGIGAATAAALGEAGASVILTDLRSERLAAQAALLRARGVEVEAHRCDVADAAAVGALCARLLADGPVDVLVNNAGIAHAGPALGASLADWGAVLGVNLHGVIHHVHHLGPAMRAAGRGHIVNLASAAGLWGIPGMAPYAVSKAGVVALSQSLQAELDGSGVQVHLVCPGFVQTRILEDGRLAPGTRERPLGGAVGRLMGRPGRRPEVVADAILRAILEGRPYVPLFAEAHLLGLARRLSPGLLGRGMAAVARAGRGAGR
jgi:NAD(P)-dependent dehydrogenase (short-subunit alcohol dehydrogenase family)